MLQQIKDLPAHVTGLHAFANVSDAEYEFKLIPLLDHLLTKNRTINYILVLETDIENFASGAWCGSVKVGLRYFFKWNRVAMVTDQKSVLGYSDLFKYIIPGKFRMFPLSKLDSALIWVSQK